MSSGHSGTIHNCYTLSRHKRSILSAGIISHECIHAKDALMEKRRSVSNAKQMHPLRSPSHYRAEHRGLLFMFFLRTGSAPSERCTALDKGTPSASAATIHAYRGDACNKIGKLSLFICGFRHYTKERERVSLCKAISPGSWWK